MQVRLGSLAVVCQHLSYNIVVRQQSTLLYKIILNSVLPFCHDFYIN